MYSYKIRQETPDELHRIFQALPIMGKTEKEKIDELLRRQDMKLQMLRHAQNRKAEDDKRLIHSVLSEKATFAITYVPFVIAEVAWDYADTAIELAILIHNPSTRPICREIRELRQKYDHGRYRFINSQWRKSETENMIMFQSVLDDYFGDIYRKSTAIMTAEYPNLDADGISLLASAYLCVSVIKGLKRYAAAQEKVLSDIVGYKVGKIIPEEMTRLQEVMGHFAAEHPFPGQLLSLQEEYADTLAQYISDTDIEETNPNTNNQKTNTMTKEEIYKSINEKTSSMLDNLRDNVEKGNKAAGARARKLSLELEKLFKEYRKISVK